MVIHNHLIPTRRILSAKGIILKLSAHGDAKMPAIQQTPLVAAVAGDGRRLHTTAASDRATHH
jgi:hypothetical protein